jgi:hypothetical protein
MASAGRAATLLSTPPEVALVPFEDLLTGPHAPTLVDSQPAGVLAGTCMPRPACCPSCLGLQASCTTLGPADRHHNLPPIAASRPGLQTPGLLKPDHNTVRAYSQVNGKAGQRTSLYLTVPYLIIRALAWGGTQAHTHQPSHAALRLGSNPGGKWSASCGNTHSLAAPGARQQGMCAQLFPPTYHNIMYLVLD